MAVDTKIGSFATTAKGRALHARILNSQARQGFTLVELMIVMTIVAILTAIAIPNYQWALIRAKEAVLQENLYGIRSAIDQYYADQGSYPDKLEDLTAKKYLRDIPRDPFTKKNDTWITVAPPVDLPVTPISGVTPIGTGTMALPQGNVYDVQSGSDLLGSNGIPYRDW